MSPIFLFTTLFLFFQGPLPTPLPDTYTLGPGDQIIIRVLNLEEIDNRPVPIDLRGSINLPVVGRIQASGLTTERLEAAIAERLKKVLVKPDVSVYLAEMRSQATRMEMLIADMLKLARLESEDSGKPIALARRLDVAAPCLETIHACVRLIDERRSRAASTARGASERASLPT